MFYILWVIMALLICYSLNDEIIVKKYTCKSKKVKGEIKILQLSDFHNHNAQKVIGNIAKLEFDIVVITGDLIDPRFSLEQVTILLEYLKQYETYFVSGNHEMKSNKVLNNIDGIYKYIESFNITVIDNKNVHLLINDNNINLIGIMDNTYYSKKNRQAKEISQIDKQLNKVNDNYNIVLMHRPEKYEIILKYDSNLLLSGHAHGGQARLGNLVNGFYAPNQGIFPKRAGGKYTNGKLVQIVNRGLARYIFIPRIFNHCEVVLVTIMNDE